MTPEWQQAVRAGHVEQLRRLADENVDVNARDGQGQTGLMIAAARGFGDAVRFFIERGAELDHAAKYGLSALMLAVVNGHVEIVRQLVQAGADTERRGSGAPGFYEMTAADLAAAGGRDDMVEILREAARRPSPPDEA